MKKILKMSPKRRDNYLAHHQVLPVRGFLEKHQKSKKTTKTTYGVSYDSKTRTASVNFGFKGGLGCSLSWSFDEKEAITGSCVFKIIQLAITIRPWQKAITLKVSACLPGLTELEAVLNKVGPMAKDFLKENRISGGCVELGKATYEWGYQRLDLTIHPLCSPELGPFKACASMQLFWRIKAGGLYEDAQSVSDKTVHMPWKQLDLDSGMASAPCRRSDATKYRQEDFSKTEKDKCFVTSNCVDPTRPDTFQWTEPHQFFQKHFFKSAEICHKYRKESSKLKCRGQYTKRKISSTFCQFNEEFQKNTDRKAFFAELWKSLTPEQKIWLFKSLSQQAQDRAKYNYTPTSSTCEEVIQHQVMTKWGARKPDPATCVVRPWALIIITANVRFHGTKALCDLHKTAYNAITGLTEERSVTKQKSASGGFWKKIGDGLKYVFAPTWCDVWGPKPVFSSYIWSA